MLIGSILREKPQLAVTTRLIDVQSGKIIGSQQVTISSPTGYSILSTVLLVSYRAASSRHLPNRRDQVGRGSRNKISRGVPCLSGGGRTR